MKWFGYRFVKKDYTRGYAFCQLLLGNRKLPGKSRTVQRFQTQKPQAFRLRLVAIVFCGMPDHSASPSAADQPQEKKHKRYADQIANVVFGAIVMDLIHFHGWVE